MNLLIFKGGYGVWGPDDLKCKLSGLSGSMHTYFIGSLRSSLYLQRYTYCWLKEVEHLYLGTQLHKEYVASTSTCKSMSQGKLPRTNLVDQLKESVWHWRKYGSCWFNGNIQQRSLSCSLSLIIPKLSVFRRWAFVLVEYWAFTNPCTLVYKSNKTTENLGHWHKRGLYPCLILWEYLPGSYKWSESLPCQRCKFLPNKNSH